MNKNTKRARSNGLSCQPTRLEGKAPGGIREINRRTVPIYVGSVCETDRKKLGKRPKNYASRNA